MASNDVHIAMVRPDLERIPRFDLPADFVLRTYRPGDENGWVDIHALADPEDQVTLETFDKHFGQDRGHLADRGFFLENSRGEVLGTATAWWDSDFQGKDWGLVHWVAIVPAYQGRGLAKPLLSRVLERLAQSHDRCYLLTAAHRIPAIHLYLNYGFRPCFVSETCPAEWATVRAVLDHPLLADQPLNRRDL